MIAFTLNGERVSYSGNPNARLLDVLRETYHLTGVKCGCKEGECGACAVIFNGKLANSCMISMGRSEGSDIVTIDGFQKTKQFSVIEKAYAAAGAVQCGFCIPGMVLATECLLREHPHPTQDEIRTGISGNFCRCTGYNAIVKAISIAAKEGDGLW